jgi:hypothetical protein
MVQLWAKKGIMKRHSGFSKENSVERNLAIMYKNANLTHPADRYLRIGRQANVLANLTMDKETKKIARAVATLAFAKLAKLHKMEK